MYKGIFWYKNGEILSVKVVCDREGSPLEPCEFSSKSGKNFHHRTEWKAFRIPLPYNYYPRGRVEIKKNEAIIFLHPTLCTDEIKSAITDCFGLNEIKTHWKADGSAHYRSLQREEKNG